MAQLAIAATGAVLGSFVGQPALGWAIGAYLGGALFGEKQSGPRLQDLRAPGTSYGGPIRITYGSQRVPGDVIWTADLIEVASEESGKGGGGVEVYNYYADFCAMLCEGPITGVRKIWLNGQLIMDASVGNVNVVDASAFSTTSGYLAAVVSAVQSPHPGILIYDGSETQQPDPLMESYLGAGNVPAYRGRALIVFNRLALADYGNRIPTVEAEVIRGSFSDPDPVAIAEGGQYSALDPETGYLWSSYNEAATAVAKLYVMDPATDALLYTETLDPTDQHAPEWVAFVPSTREVWLAFANTPTGGNTQCMIYNADALTLAATIPDAVSGYISMGLIFYVSDSGNVLLASRGTGAGRGAVLIAASSRLRAADLGSGSYHSGIDLPGEGMFALEAGSDSGGNHIIQFRDAFAGTLIATALVPDSNANGPPQLAYDSQRRRLVYIATGLTVGTAYTVDVTDFSVTAHTIKSGGVATTIRGPGSGMLYQSLVDQVLVSDNTSGSYRLVQLNADDFSILRSVAKSSDLGAGWLIENPQSVDYVYAATAGNTANENSRIFLAARIAPSSTTLATIVQDLCTRSQLVSADVDVSQLTDTVDGYLVGNAMPIRNAISPLMGVYFFDGVESDNKLKWVKRGGSVAAVLTLDDMAAHEPDSAVPDALEQTRGQDLELPNQVDVIYSDKGLDYQPGNQSAIRIVKPSKQIAPLEVPVVLDANKAKQVAEVNLYQAWAERTRYKFAVPWLRAALEPTDVVQVQSASATHSLRLTTKAERVNGILEYEGVSEDANAYTQQGVGVQGAYTPQVISALAATLLRLMDIPLLRDLDDGAGYYLAVAGAAGGTWKGSTVYRSTDGVDYARLVALTEGATLGAATDTLGDFNGGNIFDELNSVTVRLLSGSLSSATELQVLNGANLALLGGEVFQFRTVTTVSADTFKLTGLLRGRRGTEWAMSAHAAGDSFALASLSGWQRVNTSTAELNLERSFKAVTFGGALSAAVAKAFTNNGRGLLPYAGVEIGGGKDGSGDLLINWKRRTRIAGEWRDYVDVPLGEDSESYEVEILNDAGGVARTLTASSPTVTYTAAQQATDFPLAWSQIGGGGLNGGWNLPTGNSDAFPFVVGGVLYVATQHSGNGAGIYKWSGTSWTQIAGGGVNSSPSTAERYCGLVEYGGQLHAMLVNAGTYAECWRFNGTDTWTKIGGGATATNGSWAGATFFRVARDAVAYGSNLLVGIGGATGNDGEVWSWNGTTWTKIGGDGVNSSWSADAEWVYSMCLHAGKVYIGNSFSAGDADVWEWNGSSWTQVGGDGTGWAASTYEVLWSLASDGTLLYAGLGMTAGDAEIYSYNGSSWTKIGGDGLNSSWNTVYENVQSILCHSNGRVYAGLGDTTGDDEVWEWNGSSWTKIGGDSVLSSWGSTAHNRVSRMAEYNGKLVAGVGNSTGDGEAWIIGNPANPVPDPLNVQIYQLSATVGRGTVASGSVRY